MAETVTGSPEHDQWTTTHDLALIFIAVAYGTDFTLNQSEVDSIHSLIMSWNPALSDDAAKEVVLEAVVAFMQDDASEEVTRSITALRDSLTQDQRRKALEHVMHIAECDGMILGSERSLIDLLAESWAVKDTALMLYERSLAETDSMPDTWSLMHDVALLFIVMAHAMDNNLSRIEIDTMVARLGEWQPDMQEEDVREVILEALQFYAEEPEAEVYQRSVKAIQDALPVVQRLAVLNDLAHIAGSDDVVNRNEAELLRTLAVAWNVGVRFVGPLDEETDDGE
jgi:uncharacterized tellurite resistance protein B-like protein